MSLVALALTACNPKSDAIVSIADEIASIEAEVGTITKIDCPLKLSGSEVEGGTYDCGVYTAPLDYGDPAGKRLNLAFTVLHAKNPNPLPDPVVYLAGGPGQSGMVSAGGALYGDLRQDRDLIFPAQRGTLFSQRLALDECVALLGEQMGKSGLDAFVGQFAARDKLDRTLPYDQYLAQYSQTAGAINERCHQAFSAAGLDPAQFTTANSTNDLAGLLGALGYDSFNLHGVSYGTRLALETMRRHPEANIRSVVLDSPSAPSVDRLTTFATATHDSVLRLFEVCAADAGCAAAYPNLTARTAALLEQLARQPLVAGDRSIGQNELIRQLTDLTNTRANYIPRMIAELEAGDAATYLALLNGEVGAASAGGGGASSAVTELVSQISTAAAGADEGDLMAGLRVVTEVLAGAREADPQSGMKAVASEKLAGSPLLPDILARIDALTQPEIDEVISATAGDSQKVDKAEAEKATQALAKNNALFMLSGIVCHEQLPFSDVDAALAAGRSAAIPALRASDALLATELGNCTNYPMGQADASYHEPVSSDIPVLILQGEFDVRTPLANGRALAEQLANASLVIVPQTGHETWTSAGCVAQIGRSFIANPGQAPDLTCLQDRQERFSLLGEPSKDLP